MPDALTNFRIKMTSTPPGIEVDSDITGITSFPKILFQDSIFDFYPTGEVVINDKSGAIIESFFFIEGMDFNIVLENTTDDLFPSMEEILSGLTTIGSLEGDYVWANYQINNTVIESHIAGHNVFLFDSKYQATDIKKSRAWNYETGGVLNPLGAKPISEITRQMAIEDFGITNPLLQKITPTAGFDYWPQHNTTNRNFIKNILEKNAFSPGFPTSPFFSFINLSGEFYFMALQQMYLQKPVATYTLQSIQDDMSSRYDYFTIKDFIIQFGGADINRDVYTIRSYFLEMNTGEVLKQGLKDYNIHEAQLASEGLNKFTILNSATQNQLFSVNDFGLGFMPQQLETFLGRQNSKYQDSDTSYRVVIIVHFNPYCVAGKTIEIIFSKASKFDLPSSEFFGNWLILSSKVLVSDSGTQYSQLVLCKSGVIVDPTNPYQALFFGLGV